MEHEERLRAALADRYQIEREIGSGGMATVYLAQDLRHDRKVAVKVLKPELAAVVGTERFLAEIRTTANLAHPHILPLFDSGEADGFLFYVMPYVEGESLRQKLNRDGQLPVEEAVRVGGHVADALDYAHQQGVIHRDIKPGNILFQAGDPVVTDFGIALAISAAGEGRLTDTGLSLGTPYYMSPEQASGDHTPTPASDVYSLGCVLYEMLTGDPPHTGSSAQAILGKILLGEVTRPTKLRRTIPLNVEGALLRAVERLPADRFASAAELSRALQDKSFRHGVRGEAGWRVSPGPWRNLALASAAAAVLLLVAGLTGVLGPKPEPLPTARYGLEGGENLTGVPMGLLSAISPDGSVLVIGDTAGAGDALWSLAWKRRGEQGFTRIPGAELGLLPCFSPDGQWLLFQRGAELIKSPLTGGGSVTLARDLLTGTSYWSALTWLEDGSILYTQPGYTLVQIPGDGGAPPDTVFTFSSSPDVRVLAQVLGLPGSEAALAITCTGGCRAAGADLSVVDLQQDTTWVLREGVVQAWYHPTGHLIYVQPDGSVYASPFDLESLELGTGAVPLMADVQTGASWADMKVAADGTVLYVGGPPASGVTQNLAWVNRAGVASRVDPGMDYQAFGTLALAPDEGRVAVTIFDESGLEHLWVKGLPDGPLTRLTSDSARARRPVWSLDGRSIAFVTNVGGPYHARTIRADGSSVGASEVLVEREKGIWEVEYTPDGNGLLFREGDADLGDADIGYLDLATGEVREVLATDFNEGGIALSPDGRWLAYTSDQTGRREIFVRPFPNVDDGLTQVSSNGGNEARWSPDGREIFFIDPELWLTVAEYTTDSAFTVQSRSRLFQILTRFSTDAWAHGYDVAGDGSRFLFVSRFPLQDDLSEERASLVLILNWFTEVEEKLGGGR